MMATKKLYKTSEETEEVSHEYEEPRYSPPPSKKPANLLIILLIAVSFFAGYLFFKVKDLEEKKTTAPAGEAAGAQTQTASPLSVDNLKKYAKDLGLNTKEFDSCLDSGKKKDIVSADTTEGGKVGVNGTPTFLINGRLLVGAQPFEIFKEIIDKEIDGKGSNNHKDYSQTLQQYYEDPQGKSFDPEPKTVDLAKASPKGKKNAKVTIVDFSDFECPFCARSYPTIKQIEKTYGNDVVFYYKHYPLPFHPNAPKAAEASICAQDQGKFWEYHDKLFETQSG